jgi:hypothetical protein
MIKHLLIPCWVELPIFILVVSEKSQLGLEHAGGYKKHERFHPYGMKTFLVPSCCKYIGKLWECASEKFLLAYFFKNKKNVVSLQHCFACNT